MTREEASNKLNWALDNNMIEDVQSAYDYIMAIKMAIEALKQEPCEDAISRQAVLDMMQMRIGGKELYKAVYGLPSVTPHPKTGHWIRWYEQKEYDWGTDNIPHCKCSECGKEYDPHSSQFIKYCCACGAKMAESEDKK